MLPIIFALTIPAAGVALYFVYKDKLLSLFGALLYGLMPYRVYVCFDLKDLGQAVFWMVLPIIFLCLAKMYPDEKKKSSLLWSIPALILLCGIAKADCMLLFIFCGILFFLGLLLKRFLYLPLSVVAVLGSVAVNSAFWKFILLGHMNQYAVESELIASKGYSVGHFLMSWLYYEGRPGLGFGLLLALALILWYFLSDYEKPDKCPYEKKERNRYLILVIFSAILGFLSMHLGIWDIAERVHPIFIRLISFINSPSVMFGFGCALLCIPAAKSYGRLWKEKNTFIAKAMPVTLLLLNLTAVIYQICTLRTN